MEGTERPQRRPFSQKPCGSVGVSSAPRGRGRGRKKGPLSFATWLVFVILAAGAGVAPLSVPPAPAGPVFGASQRLGTDQRAARSCSVARLTALPRCCGSCATLARLRGGEGADPPGEQGGAGDAGGSTPPGGGEVEQGAGLAREGDAAAAPISPPIKTSAGNV